MKCLKYFLLLAVIFFFLRCHSNNNEVKEFSVFVPPLDLKKLQSTNSIAAAMGVYHENRFLMEKRGLRDTPVSTCQMRPPSYY